MTQSKIALLSVSDKSGLVDFAKGLVERGFSLVSTGGTAKMLSEGGLSVTSIDAMTGFPEMMNGRVKTLHPKVHGGILHRRDDAEHLKAKEENGIPTIDMVVVNLYPFEATAAETDDWDRLIEQIDIGGPSMLRSAAKNHRDVWAVTDPKDYGIVLESLNENEDGQRSLRRKLALKVFERTAAYDAAIAQKLGSLDDDDTWPQSFPISTNLVGELRYGENPHQRASIYATPGDEIRLAGTMPTQGKALSYNNMLDAEAAFFSLRCLIDGHADKKPGAIVIKHCTPCGAARGETLVDAFNAALSGDPVSAFGGIVALSEKVDAATAQAMSKIFLEVILAPEFSPEAAEILSKKKNLRLLPIKNIASGALPAHVVRGVPGGVLVQEYDRPFAGIRDAKVATERAPTEQEWADLDTAFRISAAVRSNAITLASGGKLLGAGGGQTSRVDAVELAVKKALAHGHELKGASLGSDAFFPFPDGVERAAEAGVSAVAQPGGSKRDDEVIAACNQAGIAMVFTGERHFRH